ncbi:unnamed protein product [Dibothriocephalus latus]|uniref:Iron hydrogenase large subunit C-terminal domain-containing protein n=1 Tax=Dibothriocephalus latus TaxID=60516 RepID=A0A3P6TCX0_DIBLA|nr:unnamed protein product [Dibothriocephalus latus]
MNFSTALRLNDVDDYIAPAQSCIKPVKVPTSFKPTSITIGDDGSYVATDTDGRRHLLPKAKIDLNDCLACTGCITTAETILISQHSVSTFMEALRPNGVGTRSDFLAHFSSPCLPNVKSAWLYLHSPSSASVRPYRPILLTFLD